jgi:hypothetical protein
MTHFYQRVRYQLTPQQKAEIDVDHDAAMARIGAAMGFDPQSVLVQTVYHGPLVLWAIPVGAQLVKDPNIP